MSNINYFLLALSNDIVFLLLLMEMILPLATACRWHCKLWSKVASSVAIKFYASPLKTSFITSCKWVRSFHLQYQHDNQMRCHLQLTKRWSLFAAAAIQSLNQKNNLQYRSVQHSYSPNQGCHPLGGISLPNPSLVVQTTAVSYLK